MPVPLRRVPGAGGGDFRVPFDDDMRLPVGGGGQLPADDAEPMGDFESVNHDPGHEFIPSRGGETPREGQQGGGGGGQATPTRPMEPQPISGQTPIQVTQPMASASPQALTSTLRNKGAYGGPSGLTQGGFGLPFDPTSNNKSDPIQFLIQQLIGGR
jgi:hypothetical protein